MYYQLSEIVIKTCVFCHCPEKRGDTVMKQMICSGPFLGSRTCWFCSSTKSLDSRANGFNLNLSHFPSSSSVTADHMLNHFPPSNKWIPFFMSKNHSLCQCHSKFGAFERVLLFLNYLTFSLQDGLQYPRWLGTVNIKSHILQGGKYSVKNKTGLLVSDWLGLKC